MKAEFWKKGTISIVVALIFLFISLGTVIAGIVVTLNDSSLWYLIAIGGAILLMSIGLLFSSFEKVVLSDDGIELKYGKKQLTFINWYDITDIKAKLGGKALGYLTFFKGAERIDLILDFKPFNAVMDICPNANVKYQIANLPQLADFIKMADKKRQKDK